MLCSLYPGIIISYSLSYLATSLADDPDTSIQVLLNKAHVPNTKAMYRIV